MKYQPIPRLGVAFYPDRNQAHEQTILLIAKVVFTPLYAALRRRLHRVVKSVLQF